MRSIEDGRFDIRSKELKEGKVMTTRWINGLVTGGLILTLALSGWAAEEKKAAEKDYPGAYARLACSNVPAKYASVRRFSRAMHPGL